MSAAGFSRHMHHLIKAFNTVLGQTGATDRKALRSMVHLYWGGATAAAAAAVAGVIAAAGSIHLASLPLFVWSTTPVRAGPSTT
jgi:hypothetical protein